MTTPYSTMHAAIRVEAERIAKLLQLPHTLPNKATGGGLQAPATVLRAELDVVANGTELDSYGDLDGILWRKRAELIWRLRAPLTQGVDRIQRRATQIVQRLRYTRVSDVEYQLPVATALQRESDDHGECWTIAVSCPCYHDDVSLPDEGSGAPESVTAESAANTTRTRFREEVAAPHGIPTTYDNDGSQNPPAQQAFRCRFDVMTAQAVPVGVGSRSQTHGFASAVLMEPIGEGVDATLAAADAIALRFRAVTVAGVAFGKHEAVAVETLGRRGAAYETAVVIPFLYHER